MRQLLIFNKNAELLYKTDIKLIRKILFIAGDIMFFYLDRENIIIVM